jgi:putative isomerase
MRIRARIRAITLLLLAIAPSSILAQERVLVGAYDAAHANGLVVITNNQNFFGLRFLVYRQGAPVEATARQLQFGAHAPGGAYSRIDWRSQFDDSTPITLRWTRFGRNAVIGRLSAPAGVRVAMEAYCPWETELSWAMFSTQPDRRAIFGEQVQITSPGLRRFLVRVDRTAIGAANYNDAAAMRAMLARDGHAQQASPAEERVVSRFAGLSFDLSQNQSIGFVAVAGDDFDAMEREAAKLLQRPVAEALDRAEKSYEAVRATSGGALGESLETVSRALNWNRSYWADKSLEFIANHRQAGGQAGGQAGRNAALGWDSFLTGTMMAMFDGPAASATMHALLEGQLPDGRVPLRRHLSPPPSGEPVATSGRSMPPVGALSVWRVYLATRDLELLAYAYPRLKQWNEWWFADRGDGQAWRDGNNDGLLEWGYDAAAEQGALGARMLSQEAKRRLAFSESGLEDRPQWSGAEPQSPEAGGSANGAGKQPPPDPRKDAAKFNDKSRTLEFSPVGLNALYALDTETMGTIARELGLLAEAGQWQSRHEKIRAAINAKLWSEEDKLYLNRHWDGRFSRRVSLENFYPLLAGLADEERAKQMLEALRDPNRFGLLHPMPSISRDDPSFDGKSAGRGAIWAPMNYLLYLGLRRYGFSDEAGELARRGSAIARGAFEAVGKLHDLFSSVDDSAIDEEGRTWFAGAMLWPAIEELICADPWTGLSFGGVATIEESRVESVNFFGASFDAIVGPKRTVVRRGGKIEVECEAPARLRAYRDHDRATAFVIETKEETRVLVPAAEGRKITVSMDDKVLGSTSAGASASFKVPAGIHKVLIVK